MFDELLDPSILNEFILESKEHLESVENSLIALEREADDINSVNILFRALHSIKGGASFLGLKKVTKITHELEDLLDSIRRGKTVLTPSIADTLLEAKDVLILIFDEILASLESQTGKSLQLECLESGIDISSLVSTIEVVKNETQPSLTGKTQCCVAGKTITQKHDDTAAKESSGAPDAFPHNNDAEADQESKNIFCDSLKTHLDKIQNAITNTGNAIFEKNTFHTIGKIFGEIKHAADYLDFYIIKEFSERCEYYCKIAENKDKFDSVEFKSLVIKSLEFFLDCIANIQQSGMEKEPDTCLLADMLIAVQYAEKLPDVSSECFAENQSEEFEPIKTNEN
ncbi:Hpt domain-containing protein, partial [bacterium]|nr:Hpt domain-containing protein [bacterium]